MRTTTLKPEELLIGISGSGMRTREGSASYVRTTDIGGIRDMEAYCLKCRTQREMQNPTPVTMKNGKPATKGVCPVCGTGMYKIGKAS
jgi:hypothetical protein